MAANEPLAEYKRAGFSLRVYGNRIEVEQVGIMWVKKRTVLLLRNIASAETNRARSKLIFKLNDGTKHEWATGFDTDRLYDAIMAAL